MPIVSRTIDNPASSVTPFPSKVASVREKRATSTFATRSPTIGRRRSLASSRALTAGLRILRRVHHPTTTAAAIIAHHHFLSAVPTKITTWVANGSALPACANVCWNCGTT